MVVVRNTKNCCINKSLNSDKIISKLLEVQREKFIKTFGREPGPDDPVFFNEQPDNTSGSPEPFSSELYDKMMIQLIESIGDKDDYEAFLYAYKKTGRIVTKNNQKYLTDAELKEWDDAIKEYHRLSES